MAVITTHLLNSVMGTHAGGVGVCLSRLEPSGARSLIFDRETDAGGRLSASIEIPSSDLRSEYELVFRTGRYFAKQALPQPNRQIVSDVVIRFTMPDPDASYHLPLMIAPNSYSAWWSS